jgi:hypothetical protein
MDQPPGQYGQPYGFSSNPTDDRKKPQIRQVCCVSVILKGSVDSVLRPSGVLCVCIMGGLMDSVFGPSGVVCV